MALAAQALDAKKAWKPLEQGRALEQVAARINRVMGLTFEVTGRRSGEAAEGTCKRSLQAVRVDREVRGAAAQSLGFHFRCSFRQWHVTLEDSSLVQIFRQRFCPKDNP